MKLLEKIIVNVELENSSYEYLKAAKKLAEKFNSRIILLCVLPIEASSGSIKKYVKSYAKQQLQKITNDISYSNERIEQRIEYGNKFETIVTISELENVNLIINHVNDETLSPDSKIDILSEKLVRRSVKPVLIIKNDSNPVLGSILYPVDFSEPSERALSNAIKVARVFNSKLDIVNVFEPVSESFPKRLKIDFSEENKNLKQKIKSYLMILLASLI